MPLKTHMRIITSQYREGMRDPKHPLHETLAQAEPERQMKLTAQSASYSMLVSGCDREGSNKEDIRVNKKKIHTAVVQEQLALRRENELIRRIPPEINRSEQELPRAMRRTLAQLRGRKCPLLRSYLHGIGAAESPSCPLCEHVEHDTAHLFTCREIATDLEPEDLWLNPVSAAALVQEWQRRLEEVEA